MAEPLRRVGRYELLEVIGRGGTAVVYLANQPDLNRQVALKELSPHHAGDPRFAERFISEARLVAALNHPNIVTVHEFFEHDGLPYMSMEYLPRGSLRPYLATLTLPQIFGVAENVLAGLGNGETNGIIHRDLKPENLLVSADGQIKISDYGVARALNTVVPRPYATMTGTTIGTPAYMAPEQALGEKLGPEADLYSLGIIIWETLAGRPPFGAADTPMAVLYQKIHEPVPRITELEADVDPGLAQWLDVMLAKSPAMRFSSAEAAWEELEEVAIKLLGPRWRRDARVTLDALGATPLRASTIAATQTDAPPLPSVEPHVQWRRTTDPPPATRRISPRAPSAPPEPPQTPPPPPPPARRAVPEPVVAVPEPVTTPPESLVPPESAVLPRPERPRQPEPARPPEPPRPPDSGRPAIWGAVDTPVGFRTPNQQPPTPPTPPRPPVNPAVAADNPAYRTIVRNSRRHIGADDDIEVPERDLGPRRWGRYVAVVLLVLVAAGAGVAVGIKTSAATPPAGTHTQTTGEQLLALAVRPIMFILIRQEGRFDRLLTDERTSAGQAIAASDLHYVYLQAEKRLYDLPAADQKQPAEAALFPLVKQMTLDWNAAAIAATAKNTPAYNVARKAIAKTSPQLADAAAKAEGGLPYTIVVTETTITSTG